MCCTISTWQLLQAPQRVNIAVQDMFTSLTGASKPHHIVDGAGVVLGYAHFGMLAGARWLMQETAQPLREALADNPGYSCKIVGHSLGGGTAAMLTMMCATHAMTMPAVNE